MKESLHMIKGSIFPPGASWNGDDLVITARIKGCAAHPEVILYNSSRKELFHASPVDQAGEVYCFSINKKDIPADAHTYRIRNARKYISDEFSVHVAGYSRYGQHKTETGSYIPIGSYDWEGDRKPCIPYEKSVIYSIHVRGFTKSASSKVKARGTFAGIREKIPYLKDLGITAIELMPCYEYDEVMVSEQGPAHPALADLEPDKAPAPSKSVNYWGFVSPAYYYAPKSAYSESEDAPTEFRDMIKALHQAGIEVIMQFFFPADAASGVVTDVLRYWTISYHVDGFRLFGDGVHYPVVLEDPFLRGVKIICDEGAEDIIRNIRRSAHSDADSNAHGGNPDRNNDKDSDKNNDSTRGQYPFRYASVLKRGFLTDMRRFLKGDENMLRSVISRIKENHDDYAVVNPITTHDGFTLRDLVSYDHKHNSQNGEDGRDGTSENYSWNCGEEGSTRKKAISTLRLQQMKNAFAFMLFSQGTPYIRGGDEFGQTQLGNNNPYCHDSSLTYLDWKLLDRYKDLHDFVKLLISIKKENCVFSRDSLLKDMDYKSLGAPDISYHGEEMWKVALDGQRRHVGILYNCGYVAAEGYYYLVLNMHWKDHNFTLPRLPGISGWEAMATTAPHDNDAESLTIKDDEKTIIKAPARSVCLYRSLPEKGKKKRSRRSPKDATSF